MKTFFKIIGFILFMIFLSVCVVLTITELTDAGLLGGFGTFWNNLRGVVRAVLKWIVELFGGTYPAI